VTTYQLRINPGDSDEVTLTPSELVSLNFNKTHTGFSDFEGVVPFDHSLSEEVFGEVFLERDPDGDSELLFRGTLLGVESDEDGITTRLTGKGVGYRLTNTETTLTFTNILAHNAIEDFWINSTNFSPTVTKPNVTASVTEQTAQEANTTSEFESIVSIDETTPLKVENDELTTTQTCFTTEGEDFDNANNSSTNLDGDYSDGSAEQVQDNGAFIEWNFTTEHRIPADEFAVFVRYFSFGTTECEWSIDGDFLISVLDGTNGSLFHEDLSNRPTWDGPESDLEPGSHTLRVECVEPGTGNPFRGWDVVAPADSGDRFGGINYTLDNSNNGRGGYLDGPELFPDDITQTLALASTSWNITEGTLTTSWDDTSGNQRIQLRLTDQTFFPNDGTENNTQSVTTDFGTEVGPAIQGRATFDRYGSRTTATPKTGFKAQSLTSWEITFDGNNIPVIGSQTFEGSKFQIAQDLHNFARMRFSFGHERNSLPVESFRAGEVTGTLPSDLAIVNKTRRQNVESAYNHVTVRGQRVDGTRLTHTARDQTSINEFGQQHLDRLDPTLETEEAVKVASRQTLNEKLKEFSGKGDLETQPRDVQPGLSYPNQFDSSGDDLPLEETQYSVEGRNIMGTLVFDFRVPSLQIAEDFGNLRRDSRNSQLGF